MKRYILFTATLIFGLTASFSQSVKIVDDIYITPNEAKLLQATQQADVERAEALRRTATYKNGAKQIVFLDENGNPTNAVPDTVFIVGNSSGEENEYVDKDGTYLHGFNGSKSDYEYAQRIKRFHNPKYTITIADPGYNDIYFLDDNYWNVSVDGIYATITPTWNNPAWWDYRYSPYGYNNWAWRYNWGYPYSSYWGIGFHRPYYMGWNSWYGGFGGSFGWYDPFYYGYGNYYGWYDPYYNGFYDGFYSSYRLEKRYNTENRREVNRGLYNMSATDSHRVANSRQSALNAVGRNYTTLGRQSSTENLRGRSNVSAGSSRSSNSESRSAYSGNVNTRTRVNSVRSSREWNDARSSSYGNSRSHSSSVMTNRSGTSRQGNRTSESYRSSRSNHYNNSYNSRSGSYSGSSSGSSRSSGSYSGSSSGSSRSSGSYSGSSSGSSRSSSGSSRSSR